MQRQARFAAGATEATFDLTIIDDTLVEEDETIELTLRNPTNATLQSPATVTITIDDNDEEREPTQWVYLPLVQR